jgi:hypothetical protein
MQVRKRRFLSHLYIKCIILPRQARDKRRENSKKARFVEGNAPLYPAHHDLRRAFRQLGDDPGGLQLDPGQHLL